MQWRSLNQKKKQTDIWRLVALTITTLLWYSLWQLQVTSGREASPGARHFWPLTSQATNLETTLALRHFRPLILSLPWGMSCPTTSQDNSGPRHFRLRDIFSKTYMLWWSIRTFNFGACLFSNWLDKRFIVWFLELVSRGIQGDPSGSKWIQVGFNLSNMPKLWKFLVILKYCLSLGKFSKVHCAWKKISGKKMSQC